MLETMLKNKATQIKKECTFITAIITLTFKININTGGTPDK
jgi:hypothetical protein